MRTILSAIVLLLYVATEGMAQNMSFKTEELKRVAAELKLDGLDTLKVGYSVFPKDKYKIVARKTDNGMVEHIGLSLFRNAYRQKDNNAVLEFIESGLLCQTFKLTRNNLKYMDAKFVKGGWSNLLAITDSASFTIGKIDNKAYQAVWKEGDAEVVPDRPSVSSACRERAYAKSESAVAHHACHRVLVKSSSESL